MYKKLRDNYYNYHPSENIKQALNNSYMPDTVVRFLHILTNFILQWLFEEDTDIISFYR